MWNLGMCTRMVTRVHKQVLLLQQLQPVYNPGVGCKDWKEPD